MVFGGGRDKQPFFLFVEEREPADVQDAFPVVAVDSGSIVVGLQIVKADFPARTAHQQLLPPRLHGPRLAFARQHRPRLHRVALFLKSHQRAERVNVDVLSCLLADGNEAVVGVLGRAWAAQLLEAGDRVFEAYLGLLGDLALEPLIAQLARQGNLHLVD